MPDVRDPFPDVLRIEPVGRCNFQCVHCPTGREPNNRGLLSRERFDEILQQCREHGYLPRVAVLYHGGEPLLNRELPGFIRTLKAEGVAKTVLTTNASLLDPARSRSLIEAGLDELKVSFDGTSPEENDRIRRRGDFHRDAAHLAAFIRLQRKLGADRPRVIVSNVQIGTRRSLASLGRRRAAGGGPEQLEPPAYLHEAFAEAGDAIEFRSWPAMVWPGYEQLGREGEFEEVGFDAPKPTWCGPLFETFTILSNGDVVMCCYDLPGELVLGNVFERSMFEIWDDARYVQLRDDFRRQTYCGVCARCNVVSPRYLARTEAPADGRLVELAPAAGGEATAVAATSTAMAALQADAPGAARATPLTVLGRRPQERRAS